MRLNTFVVWLKLMVRNEWCCKAQSFLEGIVFIISSSLKLSSGSVKLLIIQERLDLVLKL